MHRLWTLVTLLLVAPSLGVAAGLTSGPAAGPCSLVGAGPSTGCHLWHFATSSPHEPLAMGGALYAQTLGSDGTLYAVGRVPGPGGVDIAALAFHPDGTLLWQTVYDHHGREDEVWGVAATNEIVAIGGYAQTAGNSTTALVLGLEPRSGALVWTRSLADPLNAYGGVRDLQATPKGEILAIAAIRTDGHYSVVVRSLEAVTGTTVWSWTTDPELEVRVNAESAVSVQEDGLFLLTKLSPPYNASEPRGWALFHLSFDGVLEWSTLESNGRSSYRQVLWVGKEHIVVDNEYLPAQLTGLDRATGEIRWERTVDGEIGDLEVDDEHLFAVGIRHPPRIDVQVGNAHVGSTDPRAFAFIEAYDLANGNFVWSQTYPGLRGDYALARWVELDAPRGCLHVTGYEAGASHLGGDIWTHTYDLAGNLLLERRYNGQGNAYDFPWDLQHDPLLDRLYIAGFTRDAPPVQGQGLVLAYESGCD